MKKSKKFFALCLALAVAVQVAMPVHAESLFQIDGVGAETPAAYGEPFDPQIFVSGNMGAADRWDDVVDGNSIRPFDVQDVPRVTLNSISDQLIGSYVTVRGTSSSPYYRMAAKYVYNGSTTWLGDVYSNSYQKQFKPASEGTYTVTLYSRSHPESNPRSASGSASTTFRIYHAPYSPNVKINNGNTANLYVGDRITVTATTAGKSYRMSAKYSCNGGGQLYRYGLFQKLCGKRPAQRQHRPLYQLYGAEYSAEGTQCAAVHPRNGQHMWLGLW